MDRESSDQPHTARAQLASPQPDAHGQAAMLLSESLLHGLIARSVITVADAVEIVGVAADVTEAFAEELGDSEPTMLKSLAILDAIDLSLRNDLSDGQD